MLFKAVNDQLRFLSLLPTAIFTYSYYILLLKDSPSLKPYLEYVLQKCYQDGREITAEKMELPINTFPEHPMVVLDQLLEENWLPE